MKTKAAHQQEGESTQAFEAFVVYQRMGPQRSIAAVAKKLNKSHALIGRWSSRWGWLKRIRQVTNARVVKTEERVEKKLQTIGFADIMSETELLVRVSMLARADISKLYTNGKLDIEVLKKNGLGYLLNGITTTETQFPNGTIQIRTKVSIEGRKGFMELLGRHLGTWEDSEDPDEVLRRFMNLPKHALPASLEESIPGEIIPSDTALKEKR